MSELEWVGWATIDAVGCLVAIGVSLGDTAPADSWVNFERVELAAILAINCAIAVGVGVCNAATADSSDRCQARRYNGKKPDKFSGSSAGWAAEDSAR